ncbi:MAG: lipocalin [Herbaspirillum sp.]|nr:lipocalin [Herbaspirillum sp.]
MKHLFKRFTVAGAGIAWMLTVLLPAFAQQVETAASVDLTRYAGRWYEIARFPNSFQKQCIGNITADYRLMLDHTIEIANRCKMADGSLDLAVGQARVIDKTGNAKLQVSFAPAWLSWIPMVWGDYWVLELDKNYSVATVGSPDRQYLWILSRTPTISEADYESRVDNATKQGFDTSKLIKTRQ